MKAYYKEKNFFQRIYWAVRHPKKQWAWVGHYGVWPILSSILFGGLLPPPLSEWAVAKGWPRKQVPTQLDISER